MINIENYKDNGIETDGIGFDTLMDNRNDSVESLAYETFVTLQSTNKEEYIEYLKQDGFDNETIDKVWKIVENEYLY